MSNFLIQLLSKCYFRQKKAPEGGTGRVNSGVNGGVFRQRFPAQGEPAPPVIDLTPAPESLC